MKHAPEIEPLQLPKIANWAALHIVLTEKLSGCWLPKLETFQPTGLEHHFPTKIPCSVFLCTLRCHQTWLGYTPSSYTLVLSLKHWPCSPSDLQIEQLQAQNWNQVFVAFQTYHFTRWANPKKMMFYSRDLRLKSWFLSVRSTNLMSSPSFISRWMESPEMGVPESWGYPWKSLDGLFHGTSHLEIDGFWGNNPHFYGNNPHFIMEHPPFMEIIPIFCGSTARNL